MMKEYKIILHFVIVPKRKRKMISQYLSQVKELGKAFPQIFLYSEEINLPDLKNRCFQVCVEIDADKLIDIKPALDRISGFLDGFWKALNPRK